MAQTRVRVRGDPGARITLTSGAVRMGESAPEYEGTYEVTPSKAEQVLPTRGRRMAADVTVHATPWAETDNASGGKTVTILS